MSDGTVQVIPPRSAAAIELKAGQHLKVIDPEGEQVADLLALNRHDMAEVLSSGRTLDYQETIYLTRGDILWSNRSRQMLAILEDTVGRHDFLLTPCSADTFRIIYGHEHPHRGCQGNLHAALAPYGVAAEGLPACFNVFMNVPVDAQTGRLKVLPPLSKPGDHVLFRAEMDLLVGLTACSAEQSNNYRFKPIHYQVLD